MIPSWQGRTAHPGRLPQSGRQEQAQARIGNGPDTALPRRTRLSSHSRKWTHPCLRSLTRWRFLPHGIVPAGTSEAEHDTCSCRLTALLVRSSRCWRRNPILRNVSPRWTRAPRSFIDEFVGLGREVRKVDPRQERYPEATCRLILTSQ